MKELNDNSIVDEIKKEYNRIDNRWMKLHYYTFVVLVISGFIMEAVIAIIWYKSGGVEISTSTYLLKYILAPVTANLVFILIGTAFMYIPGIKRKARAYVISLLYISVCMVFFVVHSIFNSLYIIFTIPILLTVIYGDYKLTSITALFGISAKVIAELFIVWDPDKVDPAASSLSMANFFISTGVLLLFYLICMVVIRFERKKTEASIEKEIEHYQTQQKLKIDELTGIYNRTALRESFQSMVQDDTDTQYHLAMMDIDSFKALNDTFGHSQGDRCLKEVAHILSKCCGSSSRAFRFGGDEFCILFEGEPIESVIDTCRQIQQRMKESPTSQNVMAVSASIGIAKYEPPMPVTQLIKNTDLMMYRAKNCSGNICVFGDEECC